MRPEELNEALPWLHKAQSDLTMANFALGAGLFDHACFHAQQAAEKAFKAELIAHGRMAPRTHDLVVLLDALQVEPIGSTELARRAAIVSHFAVGARYPDFDEPSYSDASHAIEFAREALAGVRGRLGV